MEWSAISAIADVIGVICLVGTLIYLAIQIRHNTASVKANTELETSRAWAEMHSRVAHSDKMAEIWDRGLTDDASLDPAEKRKFIWFVAEFFVLAENHYGQWKHGYISDETWHVHKAVATGLLGNPLLKRWWATNVSPYSAEFRNEIDKAVAELGDSTWKYSPLAEL